MTKPTKKTGPVEIHKLTRLQTIEDIFKRHGSLLKVQLVERLSVCWPGTDLKKLNRTILRDLTDLVEQGVLEDAYVDADGVEIDYGEADGDERGLAKRWSIRGLDADSVPGAKELLSQGANLIVPSILKNSLTISGQFSKTTNNRIELGFALGTKLFVISMSKDDLPVQFIFGRAQDNLEPLPLLKNLEALYGKRLIVLALPIATLSSITGASKPGHFRLDIDKRGKITLHDQKSRNGTFLAELSSSEAEKIKNNKNSALRMDAPTATIAWDKKLVKTYPLIELSQGSSKAINTPALVQAASQFMLLISG